MFTTYYRQYRDKIYTHFVYRTGDKALAEDLASDTFLKAYEAWPEYDDTRGAFSTWIYIIAHRVLIDHYRKSGREIATDFAAPDAPDAAENDDYEWNFDTTVALSHVREAIETLPAVTARCVVYRYVDDLATKDIAALTELTEPAVRQHLSRGIKKIRHYLITTYNYHVV